MITTQGFFCVLKSCKILIFFYAEQMHTTFWMISEYVLTDSVACFNNMTNFNGQWSQLLLDKVVFVTGAAGGIGSSICHTCLLHDARVVCTGLRKKAVDALLVEIIENGNGVQDYRDRVIGIELDTTNEQAIQQAIDLVVKKWGKIDVLVNTYVWEIIHH